VPPARCAKDSIVFDQYLTEFASGKVASLIEKVVPRVIYRDWVPRVIYRDIC
jgi:hypothetical protein